MIPEKDFAGRHDIGRRKSQQDYYAFAEISGSRGGLLLVLADGMGGYQGGEEASSVAVRSFIDAFLKSERSCKDRFADGLNAANDGIHYAIRENPEKLAGMGTTLLAMAVTEAGLEWTSVGDSALHLLRGGKLKRLNADHSMRATLDEKDPGRTRLLSAIIGEDIALIDWSPRPVSLVEGDIVIVASDGLETLGGKDIARLVNDSAHKDASEIASLLLRAVAKVGHPKQDNTTVAIIKVSDTWLRQLSRNVSSSHSPERRTPDTRRLRAEKELADKKAPRGE